MLAAQFTGNFADYEFVKQWLTDKCIPIVREVTFENVEELTEEGLPFLIFFRSVHAIVRRVCTVNILGIPTTKKPTSTSPSW